MKAMKLKTIFLCLVVMGCLPVPGYADTLQEAIDESLIVPLATLEFALDVSAINFAMVDKFGPSIADELSDLDVDAIFYAMLEAGVHMRLHLSPAEKAAVTRMKKRSRASDVHMRLSPAGKKAISFVDEIIAARTTAISNAKAKARQGKQRARHCRATLKPVDDHLEIVEIVNCVQTMEAISDTCNTATEQFRVNKQLSAGTPEELDTLKGYVTQCVTENITGFSALMVYEVKREAKDQYAGLIEKCRQEETNTLGVLGYQFIWPCFKGYLDMIDEPLEPPPTKISPEPMEDSKTLPKVKA